MRSSRALMVSGAWILASDLIRQGQIFGTPNCVVAQGIMANTPETTPAVHRDLSGPGSG